MKARMGLGRRAGSSNSRPPGEPSARGRVLGRVPRVFLLLLLAAAARAELWAPLNDYVRRCPLIVRAKAIEVDEGEIRFRILKSWRGSFDAKRFLPYRVTDKGEYVATAGEHGVRVVAGQEIVFFFGPATDGKFGPHSTSFPVVEGRVLYASTSDDDELRRWWDVHEFEARIRALALPMATAGGYKLQCLAIEHDHDVVTLRFQLERDSLEWRPARDLVGEDGVRLSKGPLEPDMLFADPDGRIELRGKATAAQLDGLELECDLLRATRSEPRVLVARERGKSAPVVAGPYKFHVEVAKDRAMVVCTVDRKRPDLELDTAWFFAALRLTDADNRALAATDAAWTERGGASTFALPSKEALRPPLALVLELPTKFETSRVRFAFPRFPLGR